MPKITYKHHRTNESEADAQAAVRDGLRSEQEVVITRSQTAGDPIFGRGVAFAASVNFEYERDNNGEEYITGWHPYKLFGEPVVSQPVIESPTIAEPEVEESVPIPGPNGPNRLCEQCYQSLFAKTDLGAKRKLANHTKKEHN